MVAIDQPPSFCLASHYLSVNCRINPPNRDCCLPPSTLSGRMQPLPRASNNHETQRGVSRPLRHHVNDSSVPGADLASASRKGEKALEVVGAANCQRVCFGIHHRITFLPVRQEKLNSESAACGIPEAN